MHFQQDVALLESLTNCGTGAETQGIGCRGGAQRSHFRNHRRGDPAARVGRGVADHSGEDPGQAGQVLGGGGRIICIILVSFRNVASGICIKQDDVCKLDNYKCARLLLLLWLLLLLRS